MNGIIIHQNDNRMNGNNYNGIQDTFEMENLKQSKKSGNSNTENNVNNDSTFEVHVANFDNMIFATPKKIQKG